MKLGLLYIGVSALALLAVPVSAQVNQRNITQLGTSNTAAAENTAAGNQFDVITIDQVGNNNTASALQVGSYNTAVSRQNGDANFTSYSQQGDVHRAETFQTNNSNRSAIRQSDGANSATVTQNGLRNLSMIAQGAEVAANQDFDSSTFFTSMAVTRSGESNRAAISQLGNDFTSTVRQRARNGGQVADDNRAVVTQRGSGNSSTIVQDSRGNSASVYQLEGGASAALRNVSSVSQSNAAATLASNPLTNNLANLAINGQANSSTVTQDGRNNSTEVTQGLGVGNSSLIAQVGSAGVNRAAVAQYGNANILVVSQNSAGATATVWQQAGVAAARSSNNSVNVQQGTGGTASADFSRTYFASTASTTGAAASGLSANVTQGNNPGSASWNVTQVAQDGVNLAATVLQSGSGTSALANIVRIAQQGTGNSATAIQRATVGSASTSAAATGQPADVFYFAGGSRSAEAIILQSGSNNSASIEQRGQSQFARIEQGPGGGNTASILQDASAAFATAIIRQSGSNNAYAVTQNNANAYILVSQTGNNNTVTDVVERP